MTAVVVLGAVEPDLHQFLAMWGEVVVDELEVDGRSAVRYRPLNAPEPSDSAQEPVPAPPDVETGEREAKPPQPRRTAPRGSTAPKATNDDRRAAILRELEAGPLSAMALADAARIPRGSITAATLGLAGEGLIERDDANRWTLVKRAPVARTPRLPDAKAPAPPPAGGIGDLGPITRTSFDPDAARRRSADGM